MDVLKKEAQELKLDIEKLVEAMPSLGVDNLEVFKLRQTQWTLTVEKQEVQKIID